MNLSDGSIVTIAIATIAWVVQFAVLKNDTNWIKKSLTQGDRKMRHHSRRLNTHQSKIAALQSGCISRHPGTTFPSVENGGNEG